MNVEIMTAIEKWADDEFRSVNGQILWIIEQALKKNGRHKNKEKNHDNTKSGQGGLSATDGTGT